MVDKIRKIIHIDMDAFFASVEQRDAPELKGQPVAVGGNRKRGVVAAASYEARKFGVRSAMPSSIAREKCPQLVFVPPRFEVYREASRQIHQIFKDYTDLIEPLSLDEAYLDVTENRKDQPIATEIASEIKQRIKQTTDLTASAGVSFNKFLAKLASDYDKPNGLTVIRPQQAQSFIDDLPIDKFYGVGRVTAQKMNKLGIYHGRDLKQHSEPELVLQFGKSGRYFYQIAHAIDDRPVRPHRERKSVGAEETYSENLLGFDEVRNALKSIAEEVAHRMASNLVSGRTVTLKIRLDDFSLLTRSQTVIEAINDHNSILKIANILLERHWNQGMAIRLLGITLSNLQKTDTGEQQLSLGLNG